MMDKKERGKEDIKSFGQSSNKEKVSSNICKSLQHTNWTDIFNEKNLSFFRSRCIILPPSTRSSFPTSPALPLPSYPTSSGNCSTSCTDTSLPRKLPLSSVTSPKPLN